MRTCSSGNVGELSLTSVIRTLTLIIWKNWAGRTATSNESWHGEVPSEHNSSRSSISLFLITPSRSSILNLAFVERIWNRSLWISAVRYLSEKLASLNISPTKLLTGNSSCMEYSMTGRDAEADWAPIIAQRVVQMNMMKTDPSWWHRSIAMAIIQRRACSLQC